MSKCKSYKAQFVSTKTKKSTLAKIHKIFHSHHRCITIITTLLIVIQYFKILQLVAQAVCS